VLDSTFPHPLQVLFGLPIGLGPLLHVTPYISSPNHHLHFAMHAHTIADCLAVVPMLCRLFLISLFKFEPSGIIILTTLLIFVNIDFFIFEHKMQY